MIKKILICSTLAVVAASAQQLSVMTPTAQGVSDTFDNLARQNATSPQVLVFGETEIENQLYIPRGGGAFGRIGAPTVATSPSTMYTQVVNGTLPATVSKNFAGLGRGFNGSWTVQGLLPPDTTLAVSPTQILQWVNIKLTVLDKTTGAPVLGGAGFVNANQIWAGLGSGSICATTNRGDPIVQYDRMAGRWFLTQFAFTSASAGPWAMCIAVSQTSDATGAYALYQYNYPNLPDYPKLGVWPDAYYLTDNSFTTSYQGSRVCAFDRAKMIAGLSAGAICFSGLNAGHFAMVPADFEGTNLPPAGTTSYILGNDWFTKIAPPYVMRLWRFKPDFTTPANSTFNDGYGGAVDSFVSMPFDNSVIGSCGDNGGACVPQPGTTAKLDTLSMRTMYRVAYRNLGSGRETLVFTQSIGPTGGAVAGIQLVEIRNPGANPPQVFNNLNFNPNTTNRWMGAAATDKLGNIGLGYSVSSSLTSPSIRINGRLRNDIRNTVRGEQEVATGAGAQTSSAQRWGDYSTMQIDPADDCTFWYTTEYTLNTSGADWATRIVGFKFNSCQ